MKTLLRTLPPQGHYIFGQRNDAGEKFQNFSPATGHLICDVHGAGRNEIQEAVLSAEKGFRTWSVWSGAQRGKVLYEAARLLRQRVQELAELEVLDCGKPISEALAVDIISGAECLEYYAGLAPTLQGQNIQLGASFAYTRREPLGVCVGIGAWNYPLQIACWKAAPALAAGNSMVFKPSELTPLSAIRLAEVFSEAGIPDGVFNVVQGGGSVGQALCEHPSVAKISLTGSVPTGKKILESASKSLKKVTLELGGKSPLILFPSARLDQAVSAALLANFYTQGEICSNGTRVFVHQSMVSQFLEKLIPRVKEIRLGDPFDSTTQMGALISSAHLEKVRSYVRLGREEGAELLCGGEVPKWSSSEDHLKNGNFITPAVFVRCQDSMRIVQEEIFGPVMSVLTFNSEEEVIERANRTSFGLGAGIFTQDLTQAHRVISQLQAGTCWINNYNITPVEIPFGGYKSSGMGRENGIAGLEEYTQIKSVYVEMGDVTSPF